MTRVLILPGSLREKSFSATLAGHTAERIVDAGGEAWLWDQRKRPLPMADPDHHHDPGNHPDPSVRGLVTLAGQADAFILVTPVYHNSYSGLLKNCLDHLTIGQFSMKPVVLLGHGPRLTAIQAVDQLRTVVRGLYGLALPAQAVTTPDDYGTDAMGNPVLKDPTMRTRVDAAVTLLLEAARPHSGATS
ncbi:NADPH-dependent FMN reductase [Streptomyces sp. NPDC059982]|uniref:NADPH-dependent FMN reductase n=1 Tax=unclassified Streptomyces TaxID=2593676 RepID=UPI0036A39CC4